MPSPGDRQSLPVTAMAPGQAGVWLRPSAERLTQGRNLPRAAIAVAGYPPLTGREWPRGSAMGRWASDREDEFFYLKLLLGLVVVVGVVVGLIEWNARRQAAAMTRELLRPATPEEQGQLNEYQRQADAEMAQLRQELWQEVPASSRPRSPRVDERPLAADERCISGQRLRRTGSAWTDAGTCPNWQER